MGTPVTGIGSPPLTELEKKLESMKLKNKILNVIASGTLGAVSVPTVWYGPDEDGCSMYLIRTVFLWMLIFGVLLVGAELEIPIVKDQVQFLGYRSGRAFLMIFLGSVALAATPDEIPIQYAAAGVSTNSDRRVLVAIHWPLCV